MAVWLIPALGRAPRALIQVSGALAAIAIPQSATSRLTAVRRRGLMYPMLVPAGKP